MRLLMTSVLLSAVACEYDFELRNMPQDPLLCVECLPGLSDTTFVRVRVAVPVGNAAADVPPVSGTSVCLSVNGEDVPVMVYASGENAVTFYSLPELSCGDVLEMKASLDGLEPVSSCTVIPGAVPEYEVEMNKRNGDIVIVVSIKDDQTSEDYYAVGFARKTRFIDSRGDREEIAYGRLELTDRETYPDLDNSGVMQLDSFRSFYVLNDRGCNDSGIKTVSVTGYYSKDLWVEDDDGIWGHGVQYQVTCSRLSPESYNYLRSRYEVKQDGLAYHGLAPGNFAYTNIAGGLGVFGGAATSSSGWLDNI